MNQEQQAEIRHIGFIGTLCGLEGLLNIRSDLGYKRYLRLGNKERLKGEKKYRICKHCLASIRKKEGIK